MKALQEALAAFWGQFAPAYLAGHVPDGTAFPYVTFEVARPDAMGAMPLSACVWCRGGPGFDAQAQRAGLLDRVAEAIPARIRIGSGFALLERGAGFQELVSDPEDREVIGGRVGYVMRYFG